MGQTLRAVGWYVDLLDTNIFCVALEHICDEQLQTLYAGAVVIQFFMKHHAPVTP